MDVPVGCICVAAAVVELFEFRSGFSRSRLVNCLVSHFSSMFCKVMSLPGNCARGQSTNAHSKHKKLRALSTGSRNCLLVSPTMKTTLPVSRASLSQKLQQASSRLAHVTHQTDRARLCVDDTLLRSPYGPSCSQTSLVSRLQDAARMCKRAVGTREAAQLMSRLGEAEAALQSWQQAEHAVMQCALELQDCDDRTGVLRARRNEYIAWRAYSKVLDEIKVLEYRLSNQGNGFRGSFQLNEFGYDYGHDVPEMTPQQRTAAVDKRRKLKRKASQLKAAWQQAAAVLDASQHLHKDVLTASYSSWQRSVAAADAAKAAAMKEAASCDQLVQGMAVQQEQLWASLDSPITSEEEEQELLVSTLAARSMPFMHTAMMGGVLAAASLAVLSLPGQAWADSALHEWMPYLGDASAQKASLLGLAAAAAALMATEGSRRAGARQQQPRV